MHWNRTIWSGRFISSASTRTPQLIEALKKGEIDALVSQNPTKMGYEGVKACVDYIKGIAQQPVQDSGVPVNHPRQPQHAGGPEAFVRRLIPFATHEPIFFHA